MPAKDLVFACALVLILLFAHMPESARQNQPQTQGESQPQAQGVSAFASA
jgi:hypothetical protein